MTRIDFRTDVTDRIGYVCRLVRKAHALDCRVVLLATEPDEFASLHEALYTFSEQDFLPHVKAGDALAAQTPIILADSDQAPLPHHQVLINLSNAVPAHFARFERMFEIVSVTDADKASGRERYRFYKQRGYPLSHEVV